VTERDQNLGHHGKGSLKSHEVVKTPLSFSIPERAEGFIVISDSVDAGLDVHSVRLS